MQQSLGKSAASEMKEKLSFRAVYSLLSVMDSLCYPFREAINDKGVQLDLPCPRFPAFSSCKSSLLSLNDVLPYMCLLRDGWISSPIRGEALKSAFRSILAKDQWGTFAVGGME